MTVLRPDDLDLHDEDGEHVEPTTTEQARRLCTHLVEHERVARARACLCECHGVGDVLDPPCPSCEPGHRPTTPF